MPKYTMSDKEYFAETAEDFLEQIKSENSHTKDLSLQEYMDKVAATVINNMTEHNVTLPSKAQDIVEIWKKINIVKEA